ncbi:hypothetical protein P153DRAFT_224347 [Dothidotthia symphoricarpi CBS 119687]|uniref:WSC domain-containing protein n=1 Tax=Dothidotthia symphoricarpi CBS 119687 TaxID=1392245 RepID=A0A6A6AFT6_9PLEO|nr:uncharacterized protein P153DRAFT_224347 [Dothidotthia symphoricarpi CBS 119687]KAF2129797.1 hypothetical protein P153DRAFT_224347 [Dothidotthia symphoricarpi CBS 119687]
MVSFKYASAAVVASLLTMASAAATTDLSWTSVVTHIPTPTTTLPASAMQSIGCFETGIPLQNYGEGPFQSPGQCQLICLMLDKDVLGLSDGTDCWCGDLIPAKKWQTDNSSCDTTCSGTDNVMCGGATKLWVVLTGNTRNSVDWYEPPDSSSSSSSAAASSAAAASSSAQRASATTTATESASATTVPKESSGSSTNTAAIAAGVVVGVVAVAAMIGGILYFLRRRRQKQAEDDYRRNAANVDQFVAGGKLHTSNSSMNDQRLDPIFVDRRQSNGSIADNEDYSRRILKVTNA